MESNQNNTIVVIPSYNEERTIGNIVSGIVSMGLSVLVIDDGSIDGTERKALDSGAMVIRFGRNLGKGFSLRSALKHVIEKTNFEWVITMDGDGQHHIEDIPALMAGSHPNETDIIIGNRMLKTKGMPLLRLVTNRFTSWVLSGICKQDIPDSQCGYRLMRIDALKKMKLISERYDIESEVLIRAARLGMKIKSVPIRTIYGEESSGIKPIRDTIRFFLLIFRR